MPFSIKRLWRIRPFAPPQRIGCAAPSRSAYPDSMNQCYYQHFKQVIFLSGPISLDEVSIFSPD